MSDSSQTSLGLYYVLDQSGEPVPEPDTLAWGRWLEAAIKEGRNRLAQATIGPYWVSTVFLGVDHQFLDDGPPILWETLIFGYRKDILRERYSSRAEALAGHARAVKHAESLPRPLSASASS